MTVDLAVVLLVTIGLLWGLWRGFIQQVATLVGWAAASLAVWFGASPLARAAEPFIGGVWVARWVLAALVVGIVVRIAAEMGFSMLARGTLDRLLSRRAWDGGRESGRPRRVVWDRLFGSVLGGAKAAALIWVVLSCAAILVAGLREFGVTPTVRNARAYEFAQRHNAVLLLFSPRVEKLFVALRDVPRQRAEEKDGAAGSEARPALERLAKDPNVAKVLRDSKLVESAKKGDLSALADSDALRAFLAQPDALEKLGAAFDEVLETAGGMKTVLR